MASVGPDKGKEGKKNAHSVRVSMPSAPSGRPVVHAFLSGVHVFMRELLGIHMYYSSSAEQPPETIFLRGTATRPTASQADLPRVVWA